MCLREVPGKCQEHKTHNVRNFTCWTITLIVKSSSTWLLGIDHSTEESYSCKMNSSELKRFLSLSGSLSGVSPFAISPRDARLSELQHYVQRETDALVLAEDVAKQLQGISSLDHTAAAEVELVQARFRPSSGSRRITFRLFHLKIEGNSSVPMLSPVVRAT